MAYNDDIADCADTQTDSTLTRITYDQAQRQHRIRHQQGAALISQYDYRYDANGNRIEQVLDQGHQTETTTYQYDPNDRLTAVQYPDQTTTYSYDAAYNRLTEHSINASGTPLLERYYVYDSRNQLTQIEDKTSGLITAYAYDANGNRIQRSAGTEIIQAYQFDIRNQIREIKAGGSSVGQFLYDYQGLRIRKTTPSATTRTVYDDQSVLLQTDTDGKTLAKYTYGSDHLFSLTHRDQPPQFYLFDALGSVVALAKLDGALQARYDYDAWGNPRANAAGDSANIFGFTGHERDAETGLYYFKARYYDPAIGQFLTQDAFEGLAETPPSLHQYLYAYANPTVYVDLFGYEPWNQEWVNFVNQYSNQANAYLETREFNNGLTKGLGAVAQTATTIAGGIANALPTLADEIVNFAANEDRGLADAPVLGSVGKQLGETTAAFVQNPSLDSGVQAFGAVSAGFLTAVAPTLGKKKSIVLEKKDGPDTKDNPDTTTEQPTQREKNQQVIDKLMPETTGAGQPGVGVNGEIVGIAGSGVKNPHLDAHGFSIRNVNPHDLHGEGGINCIKCSIATDATLQGNPAQALPGLAAKTFKGAQEILEKTYGGKLNSIASHGDITTLIQKAGHGSQGIVIGYKSGASYSHAFNVVNQAGTVRYLDGQIGSAAKNIGQYDYFWFINLNIA